MLKHILLLISLIFLAASSHAQPRHFPPGTQSIYIANTPDINPQPLQNIAPLVENAIATGYYPGAVILAAHKGQIIYRGVFGNRRIVPDVAPMRFDTIFDVASLTKVVATTTAVMQLVEQKKLNLNDPVARYWPAFAAQGKSKVTVRELLTHTSGLQEDIPSPELKEILHTDGGPIKPWQGKNAALAEIAQIKLIHAPGTAFTYSDLNFIVLSYLVELRSGEPFAQYTQRHIFQPLGMRATGFLPAASLRDRIAPTEIVAGKLRWGEVHDPTVHLMDGVSGMAGLFSDAEDLGIFAQTLLNGGADILRPGTIKTMSKRQTPRKVPVSYGLGWDKSSEHTPCGALCSTAAYGHTGFTGTSLLIDPKTQTWLIILTSRTHPLPAENNRLILDRRAIADRVAASVGLTQ